MIGSQLNMAKYLNSERDNVRLKKSHHFVDAINLVVSTLEC